MLAIKLAVRGLGRHKMRTIFTLIAIAFGHMFLLVFVSLSDGGLAQMIEIAIRQGTAGHVVVQARGYQKAKAVELLVPNAGAIRKKVEAASPEGKAVLRVFGGGLARSSADSVGVFFAGVEPGREREVSELAKKVVKGVYLGSDEGAIRKAEKKKDELWCARPPSKGRPPVKQVVVGVHLARTLKLRLCEKLTLDAQGMGNRESEGFRIVGMFSTGNADIDGFFLQVPLRDAQKLLGIGDGVHQVALILKNAGRSKKAARAVKGALGADKGLEILRWTEALPQMAEFITMKRVSGWVFICIVVVIAAIGVLNTVSMSVMERTREFGVMRALGTSPRRVLAQVITEGAVLGALGVLAGLLISWPIIHYLQTTGIVYDKPVEAVGVAVKAIKAKLYFSSALTGSLFVFGTAVVATILPAVRAARLRVLEAIHHV